MAGSLVSVRCLERDLRFYAGEMRGVAFDVTNASGVDWPAGELVRHHWRRPDGSVEDGPPTLVAVDVPPDATVTLVVEVTAPGASGRADLVVEASGARLSLRAHVAPPFALPDRRPAAATRAPRWRRRRTATVPKVLHQVWLGGGTPPAEHEAYVESWRTLNPGWKIRLWTDADAPVPAYAGRARNIAERVDVVRYEVLRRHGGVYADTDVECLRPIEELVADTQVFAGYEIPGRLCNAVMGGIAGHRALERLVTLAERTIGTGVYPFATATAFLTRVLEPEPEATLFGPEVFYPYLWDEPRPTTTSFPNAYAVHHWAMSWVPPDDPARPVS